MKMMPLIPYLLIATGLFSSLALFMTLKREIRRLAHQQKTCIDEAARPAEEPAMTFVPAPLRAGLNLNKRVHAMRMLRRGEDVTHIAAALGVPRREVELLVRVQSIGKARAASAGSD
jgi:hypothetical protein